MTVFFFSSRRRHTRCGRDWSSDVCSSDLTQTAQDFRGAEKDGEPGARADALRPLGGVLEVIPAAIEEHGGDHEPQEQQPDVAELQQGGERDAHVRLAIFDAPRYRARRSAAAS